MSGYALSQPYGKGALSQQTIYPGQWDGCPPLPAHGGYTCNPAKLDRFRLVAVTFTLVTDATDDDRYVQIQYPTGTQGIVARDPSYYGQAASSTVNYCGTLDGLIDQDGYSTVTAGFRLSGLFREAGQAITIAILGAGADDTLSNVALTLDRTVVADDGSQPEYAVVLNEEVR